MVIFIHPSTLLEKIADWFFLDKSCSVRNNIFTPVFTNYALKHVKQAGTSEQRNSGYKGCQETTCLLAVILHTNKPLQNIASINLHAVAFLHRHHARKRSKLTFQSLYSHCVSESVRGAWFHIAFINHSKFTLNLTIMKAGEVDTQIFMRVKVRGPQLGEISYTPCWNLTWNFYF